MMKSIISEFAQGIIMAILYLETTKANDSTFEIVFLYGFFYMVMRSGARLTGMDPMIITNAFMTKTVFTLIDDRMKSTNDHKEKSAR